MVRAETVGIGGNDNGDWLSRAAGWGGGAETGDDRYSLPLLLWVLKSISGLRTANSGVHDLRSSSFIDGFSSFFFMHKFSAISSAGTGGDFGVLRSWGPLSSPERLLGLRNYKITTATK